MSNAPRRAIYSIYICTFYVVGDATDSGTSSQIQLQLEIQMEKQLHREAERKGNWFHNLIFIAINAWENR